MSLFVFIIMFGCRLALILGLAGVALGFYASLNVPPVHVNTCLWFAASNACLAALGWTSIALEGTWFGEDE